jgi:hypothetical protein
MRRIGWWTTIELLLCGTVLKRFRCIREVLILREFEEMSYKQIAEAASLPVGTVMSRLARAPGSAWRSASAGGIGAEMTI